MMDHNALLEKYKDCTGAALKTKYVEPGHMFFALKIRVPTSFPRRLVWELWARLELYAPRFLDLLVRLTKNAPFALQFEWRRSVEMDGNAYAAKALELGARYVVVDNPRVVKDSRYLLVEDVRKALRAMALEYRNRFDIPVVAITGSVGKTTTSHLVTYLLSTRFQTWLNRLNGFDSISVEVLNLPEGTEIFVMEIAAIFPGMIRGNCEISRPTHGLITHIGKSNMRDFKSLEAIKISKWELYEYLIDNGGEIYLNTNQPWLADQIDRLPAATLFGCKPHNDVRGELVSANPYLTVRVYPGETDSQESTRVVKTKMAGSFNLDNVLAAIAVARSFKVPEEEITSGLEAFLPPENRSEVFEWGSNLVFNDNSHSNTVGAIASLRSFLEFDAEKKMAIIGDLSNWLPEEHRDVTEFVKELDIDRIVFVGPDFYRFKGDWATFLPSREMYHAWFKDQKIEDTFIFVKGYTRLKLLEPIRPTNADGEHRI